MTPRRVRLEVPDDAAGQRLDSFLAGRLPEVTRSTWKRQIESQHVTIDGRAAAKASLPLKAGMAIEAAWPEPSSAGLRGESIPLQILFEDAHLAVVLKPAGLVVHPGHGARAGTLVHALLGRGMPLAPAGGAERPGIVHRLDKDTSGALIVAKTDAAHRALAALFAKREVRKTYRAVVWGRPRPADGRIDDAIGRSRRDRTKMTVGAPRGREATTLYRTIEALTGAALLDVDLVTGRTHQIRVHFAAKKHPVLGDTRYGGAPWRALRDPARRELLVSFPRLALHALRLALEHPITGRPLLIEAPIPSDFATLVEALRASA